MGGAPGNTCRRVTPARAATRALSCGAMRTSGSRPPGSTSCFPVLSTSCAARRAKRKDWRIHVPSEVTVNASTLQCAARSACCARMSLQVHTCEKSAAIGLPLTPGAQPWPPTRSLRVLMLLIAGAQLCQQRLSVRVTSNEACRTTWQGVPSASVHCNGGRRRMSAMVLAKQPGLPGSIDKATNSRACRGRSFETVCSKYPSCSCMHQICIST